MATSRCGHYARRIDGALRFVCGCPARVVERARSLAASGRGSLAHAKAAETAQHAPRSRPDNTGKPCPAEGCGRTVEPRQGSHGGHPPRYCLLHRGDLRHEARKGLPRCRRCRGLRPRGTVMLCPACIRTAPERRLGTSNHERTRRTAAMDLITLTEVWGYDAEVPFLAWAARRSCSLDSAERAWTRMLQRFRLLGVPVLQTSHTLAGGGFGSGRSLVLPAKARGPVEKLVAWLDRMVGVEDDDEED